MKTVCYYREYRRMKTVGYQKEDRSVKTAGYQKEDKREESRLAEPVVSYH